MKTKKTVLLLGVGRFGRHIAYKLYQMKHEVMAVDLDEDRISIIADYVTAAQIGDCTKRSFLQTLGVNQYDVCIVAIGDNFQNSLETTSLLEELGAKLIVARASSDVQEKFLLRNGAHEVVYPEKQLAAWTAIRFTSDHIQDYIELDDGYAIFEVSMPKNWIGKSVGFIDIRKKFGINILALKKGGKLYPNITSDTILNDGDSLLVLGEFSAIQKCFHI